MSRFYRSDATGKEGNGYEVLEVNIEVSHQDDESVGPKTLSFDLHQDDEIEEVAPEVIEKIYGLMAHFSIYKSPKKWDEKVEDGIDITIEEDQ